MTHQTEIAELIALSERATQGEWSVGVSSDNKIHCLDAATEAGVVEICEVWGCPDDKIIDEHSTANAVFIAALVSWFRSQDWTATQSAPLASDSLRAEIERHMDSIDSSADLIGWLEKLREIVRGDVAPKAELPESVVTDDLPELPNTRFWADSMKLDQPGVLSEFPCEIYATLNYRYTVKYDQPLYTVDQMRAYAAESVRAANARAEGLEIVGWINEDMLPDGYPYEAMFPHSMVDVVRMFPVYAPIRSEDAHEMEPWAIDDLRATAGKGDAAQAVRSDGDNDGR